MTKGKKRRILSTFLSTILALAMLCAPATSFAAAASDAPISYELVDAQEVVENSESVPIYHVNDGNNWTEIANNIRGRDYESVIGFDVDGNVLFDCTSYIKDHAYTTVSIRNSFTQNYGTTIVHNHPSSQAFSAQDLKTEATYDVPRAIVVSSLYVYVLEPMNTGWGNPNAMYEYYQQRYNVYYAEIRNYISNWNFDRKAVINEPDTPDDGSCAWFCHYEAKTALRANPNAKIDLRIGLWITHRVMEDVAQQFNMLYYRCAADEFDFYDDTIFYSEAVARRQLQDRYGYWY